MSKLSKEEKIKSKQEKSLAAKNHVKYTETKFASEIQHSIDHTKIYSPESFNEMILPAPRFTTTKIIVSDLDSVSAAYAYGTKENRTAILDFSDFTRVSGLFLSGSGAQEECLCHESALHSVQKAFTESFYDENARIKKGLVNKDLYVNRALYSEDVIFIHNDIVKAYDVITCACPNFYRGKRFHAIDPEKNDVALQERIRFVLQVASNHNVDLLLLGAYGCGVFSQDPYRVAYLFKEYLAKEFDGTFETVVFPIPGSATKNHKIFKETFTDR